MITSIWRLIHRESGTYAARELKDDVPAEEKARRLDLMENLQEKIAGEINAGLLGKNVEVLVEGKKTGKWWGRTRTDKIVFFQSPENCYGRLIKVNIEEAGPWSLKGKPVDENNGLKLTAHGYLRS